MRQYIEDIGGAHEASMGRIPSGVKSGVGIAELKSADAINQQDLIDGLEDFLVDVAGLLTFEISRHFDVPHVIRALGKSGEPEHFAGESAMMSITGTRRSWHAGILAAAAALVTAPGAVAQGAQRRSRGRC